MFRAENGGAADGASGGTFEDTTAEYDVGPLGRGWSRLDVAGQNDLAFERDDGAVIQVNASCDPSLDIPLAALTNHLLMGFTERTGETREMFALDGREAMRTHVVAKLDGVPRELMLVVLKKDGCVYDFALVAPPGAVFASARQDYESFVGGFRVRRGGEAGEERR